MVWAESSVLVKCFDPGDLIYPKCSALIENQNRGVGVRRGPNSQFPHTLKSIASSDIVIGSLLYIPKSSPSAKLRLNMFSRFNRKTGDIIIPEESKEMLVELDDMILGKVNDNEIGASEIVTFKEEEEVEL